MIDGNDPIAGLGAFADSRQELRYGRSDEDAMPLPIHRPWIRGRGFDHDLLGRDGAPAGRTGFSDGVHDGLAGLTPIEGSHVQLREETAKETARAHGEAK